MIISGINKFSVVNYPGKVSCVLFTKGCPLHCPYCYNRTLLSEPEIEWEDIRDFLIKRKGVLDAVVISGGEPMLHYQTILPRIQEIKSMGYLIGIHLTGLNSDKKEFEKVIDLCDWIGLDFKTTPSKYKELCGLDYKSWEKALEIILGKNKNFEIRTTLDYSLTRENLLEMEKILYYKGVKEWSLQKLMNREGSFVVPNYSLDFTTVQAVLR